MDAAIEQLTEAFQCPVCYELISSRHKSRALPCGHGNVCDADLTTLWQQAQQSGTPFKCPSQGCSLPSCPPIDRLPHNWALISAGDAFEDLLAARDSAHSILSGAAKRAAQLVDVIAGCSSVKSADVIHSAHAIYRSLTQSYSTADDESILPMKPKISDASKRLLQEAEARIGVVKKIMASQGFAMVFLRLFLVARERDIFDWIQIALLDAVSETAPSASRRRDAALELRLLRAEIGRAERMLQEEVSSALDSLKAASNSTMQPFPAQMSPESRLTLCCDQAASLQDIASRLSELCDYHQELGGTFMEAQPPPHAFITLERLCNHLMEKLDSLDTLDAEQRMKRKGALSSCDRIAEGCKRKRA